MLPLKEFPCWSDCNDGPGLSRPLNELRSLSASSVYRLSPPGDGGVMVSLAVCVCPQVVDIPILKTPVVVAFSRQSICSVISFGSGMSRTAHPQGFSKVGAGY